MINCSTEFHRPAALRFDLVRSVAFACQQAIHHGVTEGAGVAASFPDFRVHDDGGFEADNVPAVLGHAAPPEILHVALEFGTERAVVPESINAAVNLRRLENEP